jgi:hypothetical protein
MKRRDFLVLSASALGAGTLSSCVSRRQVERLQARDDKALMTGYFLTILCGFLRNARATSPYYTVCDFPGGTKIAGCCTPSGKTYVSVARMLPALAEYVAARPQAQVDGVDLDALLLSVYRTAFDPKHEHYWGEPPTDKPTQRTVESSLVAIALARLGPEFAAKLSAQERANVNRWLASCTVVPERTNNHAWFTAVNQAARLRLGRTFPEFQGDEGWMLDDLKAMDALAANAADGWYSDDPELTVYDYYNFWTFGNFPLFWSRIAGEFYPDWNAKLRTRAREFLHNTPYFFAADGAVPLFGRSLLYRWALLSPLVLGYEQELWPHSPGLLRRIMRKNLDWWWRMGAYDGKLGKLRETLSPEGTPEVTEGYMDNGHPYWAMQAFTFFSIPPTDPLWTAPEERLPVEIADYTVSIAGPKMIVAGTRASGQVRWLQALNTPRRDYYRDKYNKFAWSSSFPFNVMQSDKNHAPWDQALVLRDTATGVCACRVFPDEGELLEDGVRTTWSTKIGKRMVKVVSTVRLAGEFEHRSHLLSFQAAPAGEPPGQQTIEALEGSYPLGLAEDEEARREQGPGWVAIRSARSGKLLVCWKVSGHEAIEVLHGFSPENRARVNLVYPRMAVISLSRRLDLAGADALTLASLHYASPNPMRLAQIQSRAQELIQRWK